MLRKLRERIHNGEKGFTLIELLVVILIIGILAAIALPAFLGQRQKGQDSSAKSNVRNVVSALESCYTQNETYVGCDTSDDITKSGIKIGTAKNEVALTTLEANTFAVTAKSESDHTFTITKGVDGTSARSCTVAGKGGCKTGSVW